MVGLILLQMFENWNIRAPAPELPRWVGSSPDPLPDPLLREGSIGMRRAVGSDVRADCWHTLWHSRIDRLANMLMLLDLVPVSQGTERQA